MIQSETRWDHPLTQGGQTERKLTPLISAEIDARGVFEGYASLFNQEDLGRDIVLAGAFRRSLRERGAAGIRMLYQHDPAQPLGAWLRLYEDARGLFVRGRLALGSTTARDVHALMRASAIDGLSIGFRTVKGQRDGRSGLRRLVEIDLWEVSVVTFPMLPGARIGNVKRCSPELGGVQALPGRSRDLASQIGEAARLLRTR